MHFKLHNKNVHEVPYLKLCLKGHLFAILTTAYKIIVYGACWFMKVNAKASRQSVHQCKIYVSM